MRTKLAKPRLQIFKTTDNAGTDSFYINYNPDSSQIQNKSYASKAALVADLSTLDLAGNTWPGVTGLQVGPTTIPNGQSIKSQIAFGATENLGGGTIAGVVIVINRTNPAQDVFIMPASAPVHVFVSTFGF